MTQDLRTRILAALDDAEQVAGDLIETGHDTDGQTALHLDTLHALYLEIEAVR